MKLFAIISEDDSDMMWSNDMGWTSCAALIDLFDEEERQEFTLPIDGRWVQMTWEEVR